MGWQRHRAWIEVFSSAHTTNSPSPSSSPCHVRAYRSSTRAALTAKSGSRGKIHDRCCQGLRTSSASQRRTVDAETASTIPRATASTASSGALHRDSGAPDSAGSSQASALTPTTATGGKSPRPTSPWTIFQAG